MFCNYQQTCLKLSNLHTMSEADREALRRLEQHGKQFMLQFDDYEENDSEEENEEQIDDNNEETNQIMKQLKTVSSKNVKKEAAKLQSNRNPTVENRPKNVTIFREPGVLLPSDSIKHKSLDGTEEYDYKCLRLTF
jgi:vacuolar-type H+-ATPase subunit I/STV1